MSKAQRKNWWGSLTPEQQNKLIARWGKRKEKKCLAEFMMCELKKGNKEKNCTNCLLGVGNHCNGYGKKKVCKNWYEIVGP
jgi:hypothetical protein